jgi:UDP-glucose 4-epimerase
MFNRTYGTRVAVVRALSVYGPGQKAWPVRKIIPTFVIRALRREPLTIFGDGEQIADLIWAGDVADILVRALLVDHGRYVCDPQEGRPAEARFDAGTGRRMTVNEIAATVRHMVGGEQPDPVHVPMRAGEPERAVVVGDPDTLRLLYGGERPRLRQLEEGLAETIEWYRRWVAEQSKDRSA